MDNNKTMYMTLCGISTGLTAISLLLIPFLLLGVFAAAISPGSGSITPQSMIVWILRCGMCFGAGLIMAIIAAVKRQRRAWALTMIVIDGFLVIAGFCIIIFVMAAGVLGNSYIRNTYDTHYDIQMTDDTEDDIATLLDNHDFDVKIMGDYPNSSLVDLDIYIYVSTHAPQSRMEDAETFLRELRQLIIYHGGSATAHLYAFDPDHEGSLIEFYDFSVAGSTSDKTLDISSLVNSHEQRDYVPGQIPDSAGHGSILIVIDDPRGPK